MNKAIMLGLLSLGPFVVQATPFSSCPEKAVLFSGAGSSSDFVEIDLATGEYEVVATLDNYVNAAGYNETDNYFYGVTFANNGRTFARIGADRRTGQGDSKTCLHKAQAIIQAYKLTHRGFSQYGNYKKRISKFSLCNSSEYLDI